MRVDLELSDIKGRLLAQRSKLEEVRIALAEIMVAVERVANFEIERLVEEVQ